MSNEQEFDPVAWAKTWHADCDEKGVPAVTDDMIRALAAESARRQAVKDAGICRAIDAAGLHPEDCAQAIEREAGLCK